MSYLVTISTGYFNSEQTIVKNIVQLRDLLDYFIGQGMEDEIGIEVKPLGCITDIRDIIGENTEDGLELGMEEI